MKSTDRYDVKKYVRQRQKNYRTFYSSFEYEVMEVTKRLFGGTVEKSTNDEDKKLHVDFWWYSPKKGKLGIDVKGIRKNDDKEFDDTFQWLELQNIIGGKGWLYGSEDYVAFKTFTKVVYIKRERLAEYAEKKAVKCEPVDRKPSEYYVPYTRSRWGHQDISIKVPMTDLIELANTVDDHGKHYGFIADMTAISDCE